MIKNFLIFFKIKKVLFFIVTMMASSAWSIVEVKMTYTGLLSDPDDKKIYNGTSKFPTAAPNYGLGADVVFDLPISSLGIGMRYENLGLKFDGNGVKVESEMSRVAVLVNWRMIDNFIYLGPTLSYGISHSGGTISVLNNGSYNSDLEADKQTSYSAGLELGAKLLGFRVGAEAGYMYYEWQDLTGTRGSITSVSKIDMSGPYLKVVLGFGI